MMKTIDIKDASIAEEIRKQMAIVTDKNAGLMSNETFAKSLLYKGGVWDAVLNSTIVNGVYYKDSSIPGLKGCRKGFIIVIGYDLNIKQIYEDIVLDLRAIRLSSDGGNTWGNWIIR